MRVLGSCIIAVSEQRRLIAGASMDLPRERLMPDMLARAHIGDLLWVKEAWVLIKSRRFGPQNIREVAVGPVLGRTANLPKPIKAVLHELRQQPMKAVGLAREDSRATLEIMSIGEHAVRVIVHMQQVDAFLKAKALERGTACG